MNRKKQYSLHMVYMILPFFIVIKTKYMKTFIGVYHKQQDHNIFRCLYN